MDKCFVLNIFLFIFAPININANFDHYDEKKLSYSFTMDDDTIGWRHRTDWLLVG